MEATRNQRGAKEQKESDGILRYAYRLTPLAKRILTSDFIYRYAAPLDSPLPLTSDAGLNQAP